MPKDGPKQSISPETRDESLRIARATQRPGQTKEQTRLIAQGIQKGIDQYKKQQKAKARELDKRLRKARAAQPDPAQTPPVAEAPRQGKLAWILLTASWIGFGLFVLLWDQG